MINYLDNKQEEVLPIANNSVTVFKYDGENLKLENYGDISYVEVGLNFAKNNEKSIHS